MQKCRDSAGTEKFGDDKNDEQRQRYGGGNQTKLTESLDDKGLQVNEPSGENRHHGDLNAEQSPRRAITESCQNRQRESGKISRRAENRQRDAGDFGVRTRQNLFTAFDDAARNFFAREMFDRQINCVRQTN